MTTTKNFLTLISPRPTKMIIHDPLEIHRLLDKAAGNSSKVVCQIMMPGAPQSLAPALEKKLEKYKAKIIDYSRTRKLFTLSLPEKMDLRLFSKKDSTTRTRPWMVLIFLKGQIVLGIHAVPHHVDSDGVQFRIPERLFKMQRRSSDRFEIPLGYEFMAELVRPGVEKRRVRRRLINLSTEGFAFRVVTSREAALFRLGTILRGVSLSLQGTELNVDVEVRNSIENTDGGAGFKIGVKIVEISSLDHDFLEGFLLAQMSQFVG